MATTFPHCDDLVVHAPGECRYCDRLPELQAARAASGANFTGHADPSKTACPSTSRRPLETIERWPGNRAVAPETDPHLDGCTPLEAAVARAIGSFPGQFIGKELWHHDHACGGCAKTLVDKLARQGVMVVLT